MNTITTTVYSFSELSQEAQEKAIEKLYDINVDTDSWYEFVYEDAKECGKLLGINIDNIYFSGFSSQGDGACFEGTYSHLKGSVKKIKHFAPKDTELHRIASALSAIQQKNGYKLESSVKHSGHYYHSNCTEIDVTKGNDYPNENTQDETARLLKDFMNWIYSSLENSYNELTSKKYIIETIEANEYTFEQDGTMNNG